MSSLTTPAGGQGRSRKRQLACALSATLTAGLALAPFAVVSPAFAATSGDDVVISEVYARGGSANQPFTNKFVELFNPTGSAINLGGYSVQYRSAGGTGNAGTVVALTGEIPAGGHYLIAGGSNNNGANGVALPAADATNSGLNLQGSNGTVALVESTTAVALPTGNVVEAANPLIVDLVGYGTSNTYEGTGAAPTSGSNSVPQSLVRADGGIDSDNNAADFTAVSTPTPTNSAGETGGSDNGGGENGGGDGPGDDVPAEDTHSIAEIQGTGASTPLSGQTVTTSGVVTAVYATGGFNGYYLQTAGSGGDTDPTARTASDGIFIYAGTAARAGEVAIGDHVRVTGQATEYYDLTQVDISSGAHAKLAEPAAAPIPVANFEIPATDAGREVFEGMLVLPAADAYVVSDTYNLGGWGSTAYGSVGLGLGGPLRQESDVAAPGTPAFNDAVADNAARAITLDDGQSQQTSTSASVPYLTGNADIRTGASLTFDQPVVLDYRFQWNFQPTSPVTGNADWLRATGGETQAANAAPAEVGGDLKLATFNVLNYFTTLGEDVSGCQSYTDRSGTPLTVRTGCSPRGAWDNDNLERQEAKIVAAINGLGADVVTLEEIENSAKMPGGSNQDVALENLVAALNEAAGSGTWDFVPWPADAPPVSEQDVIRTAVIYRTATVDVAADAVVLSGSTAFSNAREPFAAALKSTANPDYEFVVVGNHFKSKGGSCGSPVEGCFNEDRERQSAALADFADVYASDLGIDDIFLTGDFNSYSAESPIQVLEADGYENLTARSGKSSYVFNGKVGSLDHILGNESAASRVTDVDVWQINANESVLQEYSRYNYFASSHFQPGTVFRASDHNPGIVGIDVPGVESEDDLVEINLLGFNDFHGRLFDYKTSPTTSSQENATLSFAGTIEELRAEAGADNTVLFSAGDNIGASLFTSSVQQDKPTIEILNALDVTTSSVGNHEFDAGFDFLDTTVAGWADFEYLGANVYGADGEPVLPEFEIVTVDGVDIAIIGAVTQQVPAVVRPGGIQGLTFGDPVEAVNRVAAELEAADAADVIIAAYHEGAPSGAGSTLEEQVAASPVFDAIVNDTSDLVDAIFTAHTHQDYAWDGPLGEGTRPVIQGESYGEFVSQVELTFDRTAGEVVDYEHRNVPVTTTPLAELLADYPRVNDVKEILDDALEVSAEIGGQVIGSVTADITTAHKTGSTGALTRDDRTSESTLGNLVANALREQLSEEHFGGAEIGIVNPGGLRAELLHGDNGEITFAEANAVLPFLNDLWTLSLTGEQFVTMLEQQWQPSGASNPFLHLGLSDNVSYTLDPTAEAGSRITSVMIDGMPIDPQREYRIGTFSFLAEGGDNFSVFRDATNVQQTGLIDRDAWISYISENSPLTPDYARRSAIVTPLPAELQAGDEVSFEVSRLDLTSLGSPANTELAVRLVPVSSAVQALAATLAVEPVHVATVEGGAASVSFTVPADLEGAYTLELAADPSGTTIALPVSIAASVPGGGGDNGGGGAGGGTGGAGDGGSTTGGSGSGDTLSNTGAPDLLPIMFGVGLVIAAGALMMLAKRGPNARKATSVSAE